MSRKIVCAECAKKIIPMHREDVAMGFKRRVVRLKVSDHPISLVCDDCNTPVIAGSEIVAVSYWRGNEPEAWEQRYGEPCQ